MYKKMIEDARKKGLTSESMMWESIEDVQDLLCTIREIDESEYWRFIRKLHGKLYRGHYDEVFALHDVGMMKPKGMYWTKAQVEEATKGMSFDKDVTVWDKFVAFNAFANDLCGYMDDEMIVKAAYAFWFCDKDWKDGKSSTKIWEYMCLNHSYK